MYTYQDLLEKGQNEQARMDFVRACINQSNPARDVAKIGNEYMRGLNRTILQYQKIIYTLSGKAVKDIWSANYRIPSNFYYRLVTQLAQFILGNGINWGKDDTREKLGEDFDFQTMRIFKKAQEGGQAFGFFNLDHVEVFDLLEFVPLYDEENGALMAGIRHWQIDGSKPLRATLYEVDGYTDYMWDKGVGSIVAEKRRYIQTVTYSEADGITIFDGVNYPSFPIVPMFANENKQSTLLNIRDAIDAYDLTKSGFANDLDENQIYWIVQNAGGMDDIDLAQFLERLRKVKAASVQDGEEVQAHTVEIPYAARETLLERLRKDIYEDFMALDVKNIADGAVTATQIKAAYEPMNAKADECIYYILDWIKGILKVAGIDDEATFSPSYIINRTEEVETLVQEAQFMPAEYIAEKMLVMNGDIDRKDEVMAMASEEEVTRGQLAAALAEEGNAET